MGDNLELYRDWCFANHIYFYGLSKDCPAGFCKVVKWVKGIAQEGKKLFEISVIEKEVMQLYKQVYTINH